MKIILVGLNHKTAPVEIREKFFLRPLERELLLTQFKNDPAIVEAVILSTCNRIEIYAHLLNDTPELLIQSLFKIKNLEYSPELASHLYVNKDEEAVRHLFSVSAGLDSLILGEKEILGQVKTATELSRKEGMLGKQFNILTNLAIRLGKKARTETQIDFGGSSVSWAAMKMADSLIGKLSDRSVLIIGAGKMGKLTAGHFHQKGIGRIFVMNRSHEKAVEIANLCGGEAAGFWQIKDVLEKVDVCICSASCTHYLIEKDLIDQVMRSRQGKKLLLIDISMPRNIDPSVGKVENVQLLEIDDLDRVIGENAMKRSMCVKEVEVMVNEKILAFYGKLSKIRELESVTI